MPHVTTPQDSIGLEQGPPPRKVAWAPIAVVAAGLAIGLYVVATSTSGGAGMYSFTLQQVADQRAELEGREIKVTGKVAAGSVRGEPASKDFRFDLDDGRGHQLPIAYSRLLPDPFQEGRDAIVQGRLEGGVLMATNLTVKCPSRYADVSSLSEADTAKYYATEYQKHKAAGQP
ncbi:MAG: cytochrome c maturation protein CcmE [Myxococcales bacterium]|nr:cytochrome c maturation protein CcmE [Myxococcales bacterium]